jgi:hypothetical protein
LLEQKDALIGFSFETPETLLQQQPHAFRNEIFGKECRWVNLILGQISQVKDSVTALHIEYAVTRLAFTQGFHALTSYLRMKHRNGAAQKSTSFEAHVDDEFRPNKVRLREVTASQRLQMEIQGTV